MPKKFSLASRLLLIILGTVAWSLTMVKSGLKYDYGYGFWGPNAHDGIWHIALSQSLAKGSLEMPIFSGELIKNYHLGFDIILTLLHTLTRIPILTLYFQILPPLIALVVGYLTYRLTKNIYSVFFIYFGGSVAWILNKGESAFWSQQSISTLINPPFALSLVILLLGLLSLKNNRFIASIIIFSLLPQIKIYAGLLAFAGLAIGGIKNKFFWRVLLVSLIIGSCLFLILNRNSLSLIIWQPGWFLQTLFLPDRLDWPKFYSALNTYSLSGPIWKAIPASVVALAIFIIGNSGTRLVALLNPIKTSKLLNPELSIFIWTTIILGVVLPNLFIQSGTSWNTIQFFYYSLFFLSLVSGLSLSLIIKKLPQTIKVLLIVTISLTTLPTTYLTLKQYLPSRPPAKVSSSEIEALKFLSSQPSGTVLTLPFDKYAADAAISNPPRPIYLYESTAYVSAFSNKPTYLEDEVNLNITGYAWQSRREKAKKFFEQPDSIYQSTFLMENKINYIYLPKLKDNDIVSPLLKKVFENQEIAIYSL